MSDEKTIWLIGLRSQSIGAVDMQEALTQIATSLRLGWISKSRRITEDVRTDPPPDLLAVLQPGELASQGLLSSLSEIRLFGADAEIRARYDCGRWLAAGVSESEPRGQLTHWKLESRAVIALKSHGPLPSPFDFKPPSGFGMAIHPYTSDDGLTSFTRYRVRGGQA